MIGDDARENERSTSRSAETFFPYLGDHRQRGGPGFRQPGAGVVLATTSCAGRGTADGHHANRLLSAKCAATSTPGLGSVSGGPGAGLPDVGPAVHSCAEFILYQPDGQ